MKNLSDEELVNASLEDLKFFEILISRYEKKLQNYIFRISNFSIEDVEEILQDVFLKVWKNLREFDGKLKFSSWIYRITHNETISVFRKFKSHGDDNKIFIDDEIFDIPDKKNFLQELDIKFSGEKIKKILNDLPKKYREILVLKFLEEKNYDEISDILRIPPGTVATNINRAKKKFREIVDKQSISF